MAYQKYDGEMVVRLLREGKTPREISDITGIPFEAARYYLKKIRS